MRRHIVRAELADDDPRISRHRESRRKGGDPISLEPVAGGDLGSNGRRS